MFRWPSRIRDFLFQTNSILCFAYFLSGKPISTPILADTSDNKASSVNTASPAVSSSGTKAPKKLWSQRRLARSCDNNEYLCIPLIFNYFYTESRNIFKWTRETIAEYQPFNPNTPDQTNTVVKDFVGDYDPNGGLLYRALNFLETHVFVDGRKSKETTLLLPVSNNLDIEPYVHVESEAVQKNVTTKQRAWITPVE